MNKVETASGIPEDEFHQEGLVDRLRQYLEAEPKAWHVRYNLAVALAHRGELDGAIAAFQTVLQYAPKHMESLVNLGGIYLSQGQADLAMKAFTKALSVWDVPIVRANLAVSYLQMDRLEEAESHLRLALDQNPEMPDAWTNLGSTLLRQGRLEESLEASQKALELRGDFALAHNNLAVALLELNRLDEARVYAQKAQENDYPVHKELLNRLGLKAPPEDE